MTKHNAEKSHSDSPSKSASESNPKPPFSPMKLGLRPANTPLSAGQRRAVLAAMPPPEGKALAARVSKPLKSDGLNNQHTKLVAVAKSLENSVFLLKDNDMKAEALEEIQEGG